MNAKLKAGLQAIAVAASLASVSVPALAKAVSLPAEHLQGSVGFITGGIGKRQARLFEQQMPQHALAIELLQHAGKAEDFTAGARVKITDMHGHTVLDTEAGGPFLLVDLPSGRYSIAATLKHDTLKKSSVWIAHDKLARATFEFPPHTDG